MSEFLHSIESATESTLQELQLARLKESISHAYNSNPFWKKKFDDHGVSPEDLRSLEDLQRFPFMVKEDLRQNYPFGLFCVPSEELTRIHASSGTTGKPTVVGYTTRDIDDWADVVARSIFTAGGRPGDKAQISYGYGLFTGGLGAHYGATRLGCCVIPMSGGQTEKQVGLLKDFEPRIILVTPSYLLTIADVMERMGVNPSELKLQIGVLGAEPWTLKMREEIESRLKIDALDIYGLSEVIGPGVGQESKESKGTTILWEDYFYPEIIDKEGNVLPLGEEGELVFTSLRKQAMPVIRYRTRDLTTLHAPSAGRCMRSMNRIVGRNDDMMIIRGVNVFPSQIEEIILNTEGLSSHYQLEIIKKEHLDHLIVRVEKSGNAFDSTKLTAVLKGKIKTLIGVSAEVLVVDAGTIPRSEGKAKRLLRGV